MADNNDNIFTGFRGLILSAFVGVGSFQILAPNIWGYMHDALNMSYYWAYWFFTVVYFLSIPACLFFWLAGNKEPFIKYVTGKKNIDINIHKNAVRILLYFIAFQTVFTFIAFLYHFPKWVYTILLGGYALICGGFFLFYAVEARKRIKHEESLFAIDKYNRHETIKFYWQLIITAVIFYGLFFIIGFCYIQKWQTDREKSLYEGKSKSSFEAGKRGFALANLKDTLDNRYNYLARFEDSINYVHSIDTLDSINKKRLFLFDKPHSDVLAVNPDKVLIVYDSVLSFAGRKIDSLIKDLKNTSKDVPDKRIDSICRYIPKPIDRGSMVHSYRDDIEYADMLKAFLGRLSRQVDTQSKVQLGLQLRSVQVKGMILLISLFFAMLTLYIFFRINQKLENVSLKKLQDASRLKQVDDEKMLILLEDDVAELTSILNSLWLYLTIIVWLLVPLFKQVKDADINIKELYKAPTFSNPNNSLVSNNSNATDHPTDSITFYPVVIHDSSAIIETSPQNK